MNTTILQSIDIIREECKMVGNFGYRVPPLIISRLARGGKTTALMAIFDELKSSGEFFPIIVSFNGNANFERVSDENKEETILRVIATQFYNNLQFNSDEIVFDKQKVLAFIDQAGSSFRGGVVLLIDELNALCRPLDRAGAKFLREEILDHPKRYLVFTSHVLMNLESDSKTISETLGRAQSVPNQISSRTYRTVHMPQCFDLSELRLMPQCAALTKAFVSLCSGIPSLIFSVASLHEETLSDRFNRLGITVSAREHSSLLCHFIGEVLSCRRFDVVSSILEVEKIQWPMFYIGCICKLFTKCEPSLFISRLICNDLLTYSQTEEGGKDWEVIIAVAVILRSLYSMHYGALGPFEICPPDIYPNVVCISTVLPTLEEVLGVIAKFYSATKNATILIVSLGYNKFADFDLLVCYGCEANHFVCDGYQMKLSRAYPKRDIPNGIRQGFLFRGKAPAISNIKGGWKYLSENEIIEFLGFSLRPLIPSCYGDVPDVDDFD
jgi:hypothetical protein